LNKQQQQQRRRRQQRGSRNMGDCSSREHTVPGTARTR
jgi:hypothetical protein